MATILLSHHSSNPLEAGSSDALNAAYLNQYNAAQAQRSDPADSDDPIHGYNAVETTTMPRRTARHVLPGFSGARSSMYTRNMFVNLDDEIESEDELSAFRDDDGEVNGEATVKKKKLEVIDVDALEDRNDDDHEDEDEDEDEEEQETDPRLVDEDVDMVDLEDDEDHSDAESSTANSSSDEEKTLQLKPSDEQEEITEEIEELLNVVPQLRSDYRIIDRLGTGTFSSVYKALDLGYHEKWDNTPYEGHHPPQSSAHYQSVPHTEGSRVFVAIKRIYVTSSPERIRNEISILEDCRGCRHVSQLITAFRHEDQVVVIMPYQRSEDFRDFYRTLSIQGIKSYFRCMFRALRDVHSRGIIHRDVKPANFLFDPHTGIGTLCDFGLASRMSAPASVHGICLHTGTTDKLPHGSYRMDGMDKIGIKAKQTEARNKSATPSDKVGYLEKDTRPTSKANRAGTRGFRAPEVLLKCGEQTGAIDVWAAGIILLFFLTNKFPLFQSNDDIEALMEIAVILGRKQMEKAATLHARTFATNVPSITQEGTSWRLFVEKQNPDLYKPRKPDPRWYPHNSPAYGMQQEQIRRQRAIDVPLTSSSPTSAHTTLTFPESSSPTACNSRFSSPSSPSSTSAEQELRDQIDSAFDLLEGLMNCDSVKRFTPREALYHPFLATSPDAPEEGEDDDWVPWRFGRGRCGRMHFVDEVTEIPSVRVRVRCECAAQEEAVDGKGKGKCQRNDDQGVRECPGYFEEVIHLVAGEGVAIGNESCEFHRGPLYEFNHH